MQNYNRDQIKEATDLELVNKVKNDCCKDSLTELCFRHGAIYSSIIAKLSQRYSNWFITPDLLNDKELVVYNSTLKYDATKKTKFSTFLGNEAKWHYLNRCNQQKRYSNQIAVSDEILEVNAVQPPTEDHILNKDTLGFVFETLDSHPDGRIGKIFRLRYKIGKQNKVMPWHLVGKEIGLSAQGCINIHKTGIKFLQEKLKKEGLLTC